MCSRIILLYLVVFGSLFFVFLSIAPVWMSAAVSHCLIGSFGVYLGLVVVLFAVICGTDAELPVCLCSIAFVVLLVILWGSYFLNCSCYASLHSCTCVRLFLLMFRYGICLMSRTLLAMVWEPSRRQ